jgi:hypothetical protein
MKANLPLFGINKGDVVTVDIGPPPQALPTFSSPPNVRKSALGDLEGYCVAHYLVWYAGQVKMTGQGVMDHSASMPNVVHGWMFRAGIAQAMMSDTGDLAVELSSGERVVVYGRGPAEFFDGSAPVNKEIPPIADEREAMQSIAELEKVL